MEDLPRNPARNARSQEGDGIGYISRSAGTTQRENLGHFFSSQLHLFLV